MKRILKPKTNMEEAYNEVMKEVVVSLAKLNNKVENLHSKESEIDYGHVAVLSGLNRLIKLTVDCI